MRKTECRKDVGNIHSFVFSKTPAEHLGDHPEAIDEDYIDEEE